MAQTSLPLLQNHQLQLTPNTDSLSLLAQEVSTGKAFSLHIPNNKIPELTKDLFSDPESLSNGIRDAVKNSYPGLDISINSQGIITYKATLSLGNIKKEHSFTLNLEPKEKPETQDQLLDQPQGQGSILGEIEEIKPVENKTQNAAVQSIKADYDSKIANLEKILISLEEKFTERLDRIERLLTAVPRGTISMPRGTIIGEKKMTDISGLSMISGIQGASHNRSTMMKKGPLYFNPQSKNIGYYFLSNNNQTVTLAKDSHPCLECLPTIPRGGLHSFTLLIGQQGSTTGICFGITQDVSQTYWNGNKSSYRYWTLDGEIVGKTRKNSLYSGAFGERAKSINMVVNMDEGTLIFSVDGEHANSCSIATGVSYYVYVSLGNPGDNVTIITDEIVLS